MFITNKNLSRRAVLKGIGVTMALPLLEAMVFGVPLIAYDAGAVRETLRGGGLLIQEKRPDVVAELMAAVLEGQELRERILATQARALAELRSIDFGALLADRLAPVLGAPPRAEAHP